MSYEKGNPYNLAYRVLMWHGHWQYLTFRVFSLYQIPYANIKFIALNLYKVSTLISDRWSLKYLVKLQNKKSLFV